MQWTLKVYKNVETCFGTITYQRTDIISGHLDDFYLQGQTYNECSSNIIDTVTLFTKLGFLVHPEKSTFSSAQEIVTTRIHIKLSHCDSKTDTGQSISYKVGLRYSEMFKADFDTGSYPNDWKTIVASFPGVLNGPLLPRLSEIKQKCAKQNQAKFILKMSNGP